VSERLRVEAMLVRTSQRVRGGGSFPALADPPRRLCNRPSIPSLQYRPIARRDAEKDAKHWNTRSTRSLLLQPEAWQTTGHGSMAMWFDRHPYVGALQTNVSIERRFSRIFPATLGHSLGAYPAPGGTARLCFALRAPCRFRLSENLCATNAKRFSEPSEKDAAWPWERGTLTSLRARVSRG